MEPTITAPPVKTSVASIGHKMQGRIAAVTKESAQPTIIHEPVAAENSEVAQSLAISRGDVWLAQARPF